MKKNIELYKNIIVPIITHHLPHAKIILYGSRARGDDKEGSDIDIALQTHAPIPTQIINSITWDLENSNLPIMFDIVDFYTVSQELQKEICKDGILWKS